MFVVVLITLIFLHQGDNVQVVAFGPTPLLGMAPYAQPGQVTALHPFVMHQQGVPHPSHVMQSHFHSVSTLPSVQNWQQVSVILFCCLGFKNCTS